MNRWIKVTLVAGGLASAGLVGYGAGSLGAHAQGMPGPGPAMMGEGGQRGPAMMGEGGQRGPAMMGQRGEHWHRGAQARHHGMEGLFGRFFINRDNKNLSNDDVKKIAEAGLLWFGERNWRIGEVKDAGSRTAEFALTTENGGVIARFTMDRDTGSIRRIG